MITIMSDIDQLRLWQLAGLSNDTFSIQNAIIIQSCFLWPLIIDPQGIVHYSLLFNITHTNNIIQIPRISEKLDNEH